MISIKLAQALKEAGYPQDETFLVKLEYPDGTAETLSRTHYLTHRQYEHTLYACPFEFKILDWLEKEHGLDIFTIELNLNPEEPYMVHIDTGFIYTGTGKSRQEAFENAVLKVLEAK